MASQMVNKLKFIQRQYGNPYVTAYTILALVGRFPLFQPRPPNFVAGRRFGQYDDGKEGLIQHVQDATLELRRFKIALEKFIADAARYKVMAEEMEARGEVSRAKAVRSLAFRIYARSPDIFRLENWHLYANLSNIERENIKTVDFLQDRAAGEAELARVVKNSLDQKYMEEAYQKILDVSDTYTNAFGRKELFGYEVRQRRAYGLYAGEFLSLDIRGELFDWIYRIHDERRPPQEGEPVDQTRPHQFGWAQGEKDIYTRLVAWIARELNKWMRSGAPLVVSDESVLYRRARQALLTSYGARKNLDDYRDPDNVEEVEKFLTAVVETGRDPRYGNVIESDGRLLPPRMALLHYAMRTVDLRTASEGLHPMLPLQVDKLSLIVDWVRATRPNILAMSLDDAYEAQWEWHIENAIEEQKKAREERRRQAPPTEPAFEMGGWKFFPLTKREHLRDEGCEQGICVGRTDMHYWRGVQNGTVKIFSVRKDGWDGERAATLEFQPRMHQVFETVPATTAVRERYGVSKTQVFGPRQDVWTLVQARGRFNADVESALNEPIRQFLVSAGYRSTVEPWQQMLEGRGSAQSNRGPLGGFIAGFGRGQRRALR